MPMLNIYDFLSLHHAQNCNEFEFETYEIINGQMDINDGRYTYVWENF